MSRATVVPGFFDTLRTPVLEGRDFTERDDHDSAPVVIVNRTFAQRYFGGRNRSWWTAHGRRWPVW